MPRFQACGEMFSRVSRQTARAVGNPFTFTLAAVSIVAWGLLGPHYKYSDTWQLVINTSTSVITFLMVFVIQSTQNRDTAAIQIKLNEIIRAMDGAHNALLDLEEVTDAELDEARSRYLALARRAKTLATRGIDDTHAAEVPTLDEAELSRCDDNALESPVSTANNR